jgi:hypothetical protein
LPIWATGPGGGLPAQSRLGAFGVKVRASGGQRDAGMVYRSEQGLIQEFIAQAAVEIFDEGILCRLFGRDILPVKLASIHELQDRVRGELGPVVVDNRLGLAAGVDQRRQLPPTTSNGIIPPNACRKLHKVEVIAPTPRPCKAPLQRLPNWRSGLPDWAASGSRCGCGHALPRHHPSSPEARQSQV